MNLQQWFLRLAPSSEIPSSEISTNPESPPTSVKDTLLLSIARDAMACPFEVLLNQHQYRHGAEVANDALELVAQLEALFSVYKPRSELSILNRFGHERAIPLSVDSLTLLELAIDIYRISGGAFDITAGSLSEVWGFSRRSGAMPSESDIAQALAHVGSQHLQLDSPSRTARFAVPGVQVNPGGIGKGYALDRVVGRLTTAGINDFMVHGGLSSVVARGNRQHADAGGGWLVALKHPWRWEETLGRIRLRDQALGTSGSGKQFFHFGGKRYSHIIDPRTGWPAQGMMSVTVVCPSGAVADALATGLFVLGPQRAIDFCERNPSVAAILIYQDEKGRQTLSVHNLPQDDWLPA